VSNKHTIVLNQQVSLPFDLRPVPTAKISDLSRVLFEYEYLPQVFAPDVLEQNGRSYEERLASCRMVASPDDITPTVMGLLAIGKNPQEFLPDARVQFLRIDGAGIADPVIDEENIGGAIADMLRRTEEKLTAHNRTRVDILSAPVHQISSTYPQAALQQILYNAVLHRSYEATNAPVRIY